MKRSKLAATCLAVAALALPVAGIAEEAKPGVFKIPGTDTTLKLNGFVEVDVTYDFDGADEDIRGDDWASFVEFQPLDKNPNQRQDNRLYVTGRTSRLGLTTTTPTKKGPLVVRVEGDFNSPSAFNYSTEATTNGTNFRIRHAYGEFAGFLVGQTWSNFMDLDSLPDTVDFNPHGAFALTRIPMVRYAAKLGQPTLSISLENPQSIVLNTDISPGTSLTVGRRYDRFPSATASLTIPFAFGHLNLRGVALEYNGQVGPAATDATDSRWGFGGGVSGSLKYERETLVWSVQGGNGIGMYMFQSLFQGGGFVGNEIELWRTVAYHVGLTHAWSPTVRSNAIWTQTFFKSNDQLAAVWGSIANKRVDVAFVNTFVSPVKNFEVGVEYSYGRRTVFDAGLVAAGIALSNNEGTQQRVNALARYSFF